MLPLFLSGCFILKVAHTSVAKGKITAGPTDFYLRSPDTTIDVKQDSRGVSPQVKVTLTADSDHGLKTLSYQVLKADVKTGQYSVVAGDSTKASLSQDESGHPKWSRHLELFAVLDLSGTTTLPLMLKVTAEEQEGTKNIIESKYREMPYNIDSPKAR
jgi:hypothetical protein